jgi:type IV pilus assembly protein PilO
MSAAQFVSRWRERLASPLALHIAGTAVLLVVAVFLCIRLGLDWAAMHHSSDNVLAGKRIQLKTLELEAAPLRSLDEKVATSRGQIITFIAKRIPPNYSSISSRIGELQVTSGVRLARVQYTQGVPYVGLSEITMDAGISGNYPAIMRFVNSLERDQTFFVIRAMSLTSQQGGLVTLRLRLSTWLRAADAEASGLPATPATGSPAVSNTEGE